MMKDTFLPLRILALTFFLSVMPGIVLGQSAAPSASGQLEEGKRYLASGDFGSALLSFERSIALDKTNAVVHASLGDVAIALGLHERAETAFRAAIAIKGDVSSFRVGLCQVLIKLRKTSDALTECREAVRIDPRSGDARAALFLAMRSSGHSNEELLSFLESSLAQANESLVLLMISGDHFLATFRYREAVPIFERLTELRPNEAKFHGRLAESYLRLERDEEAITSAKKAISLSPNEPFANFAMGQIFEELGLLDEAKESYSRVPSGDGPLAYASYFRARVEKILGRPAEASVILRDLVARYPDNFDFLLEFGTSLNGQAKYADAVAPLSKACAIKPKDFACKAFLGLALFESADYQRANLVLNDALALSPGNEIVTMYLNVSTGRQRKAAQIDDIKAYVKQNRDDLNAVIALIQALLFTWRIEEAEPYVKEVYRGDPDDESAFITLGVSYTTAGMYAEAERAFNKSLSIKETPAPHLNLAALAEKKGDLQTAIFHYEKFLSLAPQSPGVMHLYAITLAEAGKRREALNMLKRSLSLNPMDGVAVYRAAMISAKLGERENSLFYLSQLKTIDPISAKRLARYLKSGL